MFNCGRVISHECKWNPNRIAILIANDYSGYSPLAPLSSAINDISLMYTYFRKERCFHEDQIFVFGRMNLGGKIIAWKKRYNRDILPKDFFGKQIYFYYSGHGNPGGKINIPSEIESIMNSPNYSILDCCYSHQSDLSDILLGSTCQGNVLAVSNGRVSKFTSGIVNVLSSGKNDIISIKEWINSNRHYFRIPEENEAKFIEDFVN